METEPGKKAVPSGRLTWRKWIFHECHTVLMRAHRPAEPTYQLMQRMGWWRSMGTDFNQWYSECRVCARNRGKPVKGPTVGQSQADGNHKAPPYHHVVVDVQGPFTQGDGFRLCSFSTWFGHGHVRRQTPFYHSSTFA